MERAESIERRGHVVGFREAITHAAGQDAPFFGWFDHAQNKEASFVRGSWDFLWHIAQPLAPYLAQPETKTALEIGHGEGRLLAPASRAFQFVIGVDIHDENDKVQAALREAGSAQCAAHEDRRRAVACRLWTVRLCVFVHRTSTCGDVCGLQTLLRRDIPGAQARRPGGALFRTAISLVFQSLITAPVHPGAGSSSRC